MDYKADWYIPDQLVYSLASGDMTGDEIISFIHMVDGLIEKSDYPSVHVITDYSRVQQTIPLVELVKVITQYKVNPRAGWVITVGERDSFFKMLSNIGRQFVKVRQRSFDILEEALIFLKSATDVDWGNAHPEMVTELNVKVIE